MRIVAGKHRGRQLVTPSDMAIRPTLDRVREAIFNKLRHGLTDFTLDECRVLDLFAGTGALGLEALSQGAGFCLFVETDAEARGLIRQNVEMLGLTGASKLFRRDATDLGPAGTIGPFGLVFLDPPYGRGMAEKALAAAAAGGWLSDGAVAVVEESATLGLVLPAGFTEIDRRIYGDTQVVYLKFRES